MKQLKLERFGIITESPHFSYDEAVEVLFEAQNTVRSVENSHNAEEIVKRDTSLDAFSHNVFLQQGWSVEFIKLRIGAAEEIGCFLRGVDKEAGSQNLVLVAILVNQLLGFNFAGFKAVKLAGKLSQLILFLFRLRKETLLFFFDFYEFKINLSIAVATPFSSQLSVTALARLLT